MYYDMLIFTCPRTFFMFFFFLKGKRGLKKPCLIRYIILYFNIFYRKFLSMGKYATIHIVLNILTFSCHIHNVEHHFSEVLEFY